MACELSQLFNIKINLENETGIFHPPESLDGFVDASLSDELVVHEMGIWFVGQAALLWTEEEESKSVKKMKCLYGGRQTLVKSYHSFCETVGAPSSDALLCPGTHRFPFHFHIPANMPSSFEAADGSNNENVAVVQYKLICVFHNVKIQATHSQSLAIIVQRSYDLSLLPDTLYRTTLKRCLKLKSALCGTQVYGDVELVLNKTGFVPGETVQVIVQVVNICGPVMKAIYLLLKQTVTIHISDEERSFVRLLFCTNLGKCMSASQRRFAENIHIPPVVASELRGCSIIHVAYAISVLLVLRRRNRIWGPPFDFHETSIPIIIGTDPHRETTFPSNSEVVPCHAYFNHKTGEICEYSQARDLNDNSRPVYRYYKLLPLRGSSHINSTFSPPSSMPPFSSNNQRFSSHTPSQGQSGMHVNHMSTGPPIPTSTVIVKPKIINESLDNGMNYRSRPPPLQKSTKALSTEYYPPVVSVPSTSSKPILRMATATSQDASSRSLHAFPIQHISSHVTSSQVPLRSQPSSSSGLYSQRYSGPEQHFSCSCESISMAEDEMSSASHHHLCSHHRPRVSLTRTGSTSVMGMDA